MRLLVPYIGYRRQSPIVTFLSVIFLFISCDGERDANIYTRLQQWDSFMAAHPEAVRDSLQTIDPEHLSSANNAYYGLLKTISDDKTYVDFTSDSLINEVEQYYSNQHSGGIHHLRSLIYQGIVRIRMGISDSTAYLPLKTADKLFSQTAVKDPSIGYMIYYHLGDLHYQHNNTRETNHYFSEMLRFAKEENSRRHLFDAYTALFWKEMKQEEFLKGKQYLDTLSGYSDLTSEELYKLLNMQSLYYDMQGDFDRSLQTEKQMLHMLPFLRYHVDPFRTYYSISDKYKSLHQTDSALSYGLQAIAHIVDSTYQLNYHLFQNVAEIALMRQDYKMADAYRKRMFDFYRQSVNERVENKILEIEKRYDLADAENKALKAETKANIYFTLFLLVFLLILFFLILFRKQKKVAQLKQDTLQAEKLLSESESLLYQQQMKEYQNIIRIYSAFLAQYSGHQQQLKSFEMKIRGSVSNKHRLADDYQTMLQQGQEEFNRLSSQLFLNQLYEKLIAPAVSNPSFLNEADRLLLVMLALKLENAHIAAFLNTTSVNLKSKKSHLKRKLKENSGRIENIEQLMALF